MTAKQTTAQLRDRIGDEQIAAAVDTSQAAIAKMHPAQITITLDADWLAEIANYNTYRREAEGMVFDDTASTRKQNAARKAFSNASMSLGWKIARELAKQGISIEGHVADPGVSLPPVDGSGT